MFHVCIINNVVIVCCISGVVLRQMQRVLAGSGGADEMF